MTEVSPRLMKLAFEMLDFAYVIAARHLREQRSVGEKKATSMMMATISRGKKIVNEGEDLHSSNP